MSDSSWRVHVYLIDLTGLAHLGLVIDENDDDKCFLPCEGVWVAPSLYGKGDFVTCVTCSLFRVAEGRISLWASS